MNPSGLGLNCLRYLDQKRMVMQEPLLRARRDERGKELIALLKRSRKSLQTLAEGRAELGFPYGSKIAEGSS